MRHPSEGVLRRLIDEPAGVTDEDRAHVSSCPACLRTLDEVRADARLVGAAIAPAIGTVDTDAAWARFASAAAPVTAPARLTAVSGSGGGRWRAALRRPAVAALGAAVLVTGAGVAAANDWLPIFQTEQVATLEVSSTELVQLPDLSAYGDLEVTSKPGTEQVADAEAAFERTGLAVPGVADLPE